MDKQQFLVVIEQIKNNPENENFVQEFCATYQIDKGAFDILKNCAENDKYVNLIANTIDGNNVAIEKNQNM